MMRKWLWLVVTSTFLTASAVTAQQAETSCNIPTRVAEGETARVIVDELRVRQSPALSGTVLAELQADDVVTRRAGTSCDGTRLWVEVAFQSGSVGGIGWIAEGDSEGYFIAPQVSTPNVDFLYVAVDPNTGVARNRDLYLISSDGSNVTNLTNTSTASENDAAWSTDGTQVYFTRNTLINTADGAQTDTSLYLMDVSSEGENRGERLVFRFRDLIPNTAALRVENWVLSPDQTHIVFVPYFSDTVYLMNVDGANLQTFVTELDNAVGLVYWSPDGREFAYTKAWRFDDDEQSDFYYWAISAEGSASQFIGTEADLITRWYQDEVVAIPPEGTATLGTYSIQRVGEEGELSKIYGFRAAVAPDERSVAFVSYLEGDGGSEGAVTLNSLEDTSLSQALTPPFELDNAWVQWSPDGSHLLYFLWREDAVVIMRVSVDGTDNFELFRAPQMSAIQGEWRPASS